VTEDGLIAVGQQGSLLCGEGRREAVADEVDTAMELVKAAGAETVPDLDRCDSGVQELPPCDDAVLPCRQVGDYPIRETSG
jgi:hypothetical protein